MMSESQTNVATNVVVSSLRDKVKNCLRDFNRARDQSVQKVSSVANLLNKKSYQTAQKVHSALGSSLSAASISFDIDDDLFQCFACLNEAQQTMLNALESLEQYLVEQPTSDDPAFDSSCANDILPHLKQQLLLERSVVIALSNYNENNADYDALVTMVACFKYPPYFRESDLSHILNT